MKKHHLAILSLLVATLSILLSQFPALRELVQSTLHLGAFFSSVYNTSPSSSSSSSSTLTTLTTLTTVAPAHPMSKVKPALKSISTAAATTATTKLTMSSHKPLLPHAKISPHRSTTRGHANHGWLNTYHSFSFADWYHPSYTSFGALRVLNEDCVRPGTGFPTHPHRDFEIFSYVLRGELTHRDSMLTKGAEGAASPDQFYRLRRGDVQFTTGGTGIAHSEFNEHAADTVHFLQIWALPWRRGLAPRYHTRHFADDSKRAGFIPILSPLAAGPDATPKEEEAAEPKIPGTIPIHADFVMGAGIISPGGGEGEGGGGFVWNVGAKGATLATRRKVFVHLPMMQGGKAKIRLDGRDDVVLEEGDGAFVEGVNAGDKLRVESVGSADAEVVVLDTA